MNSNAGQLTLAILKPHVMKNPWAIIDIKRRIAEAGIKIVESKNIYFNSKLAESFYSEHKGRFFFNRLITFMTSGPSEACILQGNDVIAKWRNVMGPTKVYKAQFSHPDSLRGLYGLSDTRNVAHGSGSAENLYTINMLQ